MTRDRAVYRCAECCFVIFNSEPRVLADRGWCHPRCVPEEEW